MSTIGWMRWRVGISRGTTELVASEPELQDPVPIELLSREERYAASHAKTRKLVEIGAGQFHGTEDFGEMAYFESLVTGGETQPFNLHYGMLIPALLNQATEEQQEKWLAPAYMQAFVGITQQRSESPPPVLSLLSGTYAQTEMGHGTNLKRLETTATYIPDRHEFELHSPTLTATKWWPGLLGKVPFNRANDRRLSGKLSPLQTANHAIVMAQLWTQGKCHGPHAFMVQLRDRETHLPLPGITVGDIGPKMGMHSNDNGFLRFDRVRIQRDQMLMRNARVEPDGTYVPPKHAKLSFNAMIFVRQILVRQMAIALGKAVTIATRYSAVRRQGELGNSDREVRLLDYQTQQYRLFPQIANALAFFVTSSRLSQYYNEENERILGGNTEGLAELHALSSGLKAHVTWEMAKGMEQCRLSCGGHGYLLSSGLPELYGLNVGACTYEGDNIVLLLQVARFLVKAMRAIKEGRGHELSLSTRYLARRAALNQAASPLDHRLRAEDLLAVLEEISFRANADGLTEVERQTSLGHHQDMARNAAGVRLAKAARCHVLTFITRSFWEFAAAATGAIRQPLLNLAQLHLLLTVDDKAAYALQYGCLNAGQLELIRADLYRRLGLVRPNAVAFVDSWGFQVRLTERAGRGYTTKLVYAYIRGVVWCSGRFLDSVVVFIDSEFEGRRDWCR